MRNENTKELVKLRSLIKASQILNSTLDLRELLKIILDIAVNSCNAQRGTIYIVNDVKKEIWSEVQHGDTKIEIRLPIGIGIAGTVALTGEIVNVEDVSELNNFNREIDKLTGFKTKSMLCMPLTNNKDKIIGVFQLLNSKFNKFTNDDEDFLKALSSHASIALENVKLHQKILLQQIFENEMQIASDIQRKLLPKENPNLINYSLSGINIPSKYISGDYFDFIEDYEGNLICIVADVTGKGVAAALLVSTIQAWLHALVETKIEIEDITLKLNEIIFKETPPNIFITFFISKIYPKEGKFKYVNAGHNPGYYFDKDKNMIHLDKGGLPLGMFNSVKYEKETIDIKSGETIVLYSDGIPEAVNLKDEFYGEERFVDSIKYNLQSDSVTISDFVIDGVQNFVTGAEQSDDWTLVVLRKN